MYILFKAEGTQGFFNVNAERDPPNGVHNYVNTRLELEAYDITLYNMIVEVFPCKNTYLKRCETTRGRHLSFFSLFRDRSFISIVLYVHYSCLHDVTSANTLFFTDPSYFNMCLYLRYNDLLAL